MSEDSKQSVIDKCFENAKARLQENDAQKQDIIHDLAEELERTGMPKDMIAAEIEKRLHEWVSPFYVRKVLGDNYTRKYDRKISQPVAIRPEIATTTVIGGQTLVSEDRQPEFVNKFREYDEKLRTSNEEIRYLRDQLETKQQQPEPKPVVSWPTKIRVNLVKTGLNAQNKNRLMQTSATFNAKHVQDDLYEISND